MPVEGRDEIFGAKGKFGLINDKPVCCWEWRGFLEGILGRFLRSSRGLFSYLA